MGFECKKQVEKSRPVNSKLEMRSTKVKEKYAEFMLMKAEFQ